MLCGAAAASLPHVAAGAGPRYLPTGGCLLLPQRGAAREENKNVGSSLLKLGEGPEKHTCGRLHFTFPLCSALLLLRSPKGSGRALAVLG